MERRLTRARPVNSHLPDPQMEQVVADIYRKMPLESRIVTLEATVAQLQTDLAALTARVTALE